MDREEVKELLPVLQAFVEGKKIQVKNGNGVWLDIDVMTPRLGYSYRIKPEPKYRPFKDAEECWQEMQKHQPFGWVKEISDGKYVNLGCVPLEDNEDDFHIITFADGEPFGVKEE